MSDFCCCMLFHNCKYRGKYITYRQFLADNQLRWNSLNRYISLVYIKSCSKILGFWSTSKTFLRKSLEKNWLTAKLLWFSPAQWFVVPFPTGLITIFYCLTALEAFKTPPRATCRLALGRTDRLLSLIRHAPSRKQRLQRFFYFSVCIHCSGNVFIEPLATNERGIRI
jgi:hypothetical protein